MQVSTSSLLQSASPDMASPHLTPVDARVPTTASQSASATSIPDRFLSTSVSSGLSQWTTHCVKSSSQQHPDSNQLDLHTLFCPANTDPSQFTLPLSDSSSLSSPPSDCDRTPVNSFPDSGTESICSEVCSMADDISDQVDSSTDRILKFFASENSKSSRMAKNNSRRTNINQTMARPSSTDCDERGDDSDGFSSDESTLSESSVYSPDYGLVVAEDNLITPETVVAAIDKQIQRQRRRTTGQTESDNGDNSDELCPQTITDPSPAPEPCLPLEEPTSAPNSIDTIIEEEAGDIDESWCRALEDEDDSDEDDFLNSKRIPLIRSTSLKTGKTPPGTPCEKKYVRFADALGLDLESVRHIVDDGPYVPPLAAFKGLKLDEDDRNWILQGQRHTLGPSTTNNNNTHINKASKPIAAQSRPNLRIMFCQPSSDPGHFLDRVRTSRVCLENCLVSGPSGPSDNFVITCIARVLNVSFEKKLLLRYTTNEWLTWTDVPGSYLSDSCDGFSDKFTVNFELAVNANGHQTMLPGQRLLFALLYLPGNDQTEEFWDNNLGLNYTLIYQRL